MSPGTARQLDEDVLRAVAGRRALAGFFLSGLMTGLPGAILPAWGHHLRADFASIGHYFLSLCAGILISTELAARLIPRKGYQFLLVLASAMAAGDLLLLASSSPPAPSAWRALELLLFGIAIGALNTGLLYAIAPVYRRHSAATLNLAGAFFALGCSLIALFMAVVFYAYHVSAILSLLAAAPALFAALYARTSFTGTAVPERWALKHVLSGANHASTRLLVLLVFFQFANEWSIGSWLPIYLSRRLGQSPASSLLLLALYWFWLLVARVRAISVLSRVRPAWLLVASTSMALFGCFILLFTNNLFGALTGVLLASSGFAMIYPLAGSRIGTRFKEYQPGFFTGVLSCAMVGAMLAPATLGYLANWWGVRVVMGLPLIGTCLVVGLLWLLWLRPVQK